MFNDVHPKWLRPSLRHNNFAQTGHWSGDFFVVATCNSGTNVGHSKTTILNYISQK